MKYFVIHSGKDFECAKKLMDAWSEIYDNAQFIVLEGNQENWQGDAVARIRECSKVLYIVGETSAQSQNIQIELDIANKENKEIYVYKLSKNNRVNDCLLNDKALNTSVGEYEGEYVIGKMRSRIFILDYEQLAKKMKNDSEEIEVILKGSDFSDKEILMEQYKMFVQTSEDLVNRKQSVNTFYVTLNSILLSGIVSVICAAGEILHIASGNDIIYAISAFLSVIGIVICCSWITLLNSYSDLNASKMAIIGCIEERLALKLFDTEWALLTRRIGNKKYKSFTVKEVAVAKIFLGLYSVVIFLCGILFVFK